MTLPARTLALPVALVGALLLPACGDDDGTAETSSGPASSGPTSSGSPTSSGPITDGTTVGPDPSTSGTSTNGTSTSGTGVDSTTGAEALCNGWSERGPAMPWLELYDVMGQPLAAGGTVALTCGGQGSWMFPIFPEMGGWELAEPSLVFSVEVVVEGFPGPFGSFYSEPEYYYGLQCFQDTFDGGFAHDCIAVIPPDTIADLAALDGAAATVHIELAVDGGEPLVMDLADMTLSAPADIVAEGCAFG
jgi:hypothetical protein